MRLNPESIRNIIISRTDKIGDIILTLPLITECKRIFKNSKITFLTNSIIKDLIEGYEDIDRIIYYDKYETFKEKLKIIREGNYDIAISAYPRFEIALLFFTAGIETRIGTAYRVYSFLYNKKIKEHRKYADKHEAQYNINLMKAIAPGVRDEFVFKFKYNKSERDALKTKLINFNFDIDEKYIIIHPGSKGSAIDIPVDIISDFTKDFLKENSGYKIVLTGTEEEESLSNKIHISSESPERVIKLIGKLNLRELMILIDSSEIFISHSTGPIHIAGALNKKIIGFYPSIIPMTANRWRPLSRNAIILSPQHTTDMSEISKESIKSAINKLLNN